MTHDLPYALQLCPRALVMNEGRIVADGATPAILADSDLMHANRLELPFGFFARRMRLSRSLRAWMSRRSLAPIDPAALDAVLAPFGESHMLPRAAYIDEAVLAWEQDAFFRDGWVCAGRAEDVANPGDQRARSVGGSGLLMVRDSDGALHTFANACRHRGHELLPCDGTSNRGVIQCPYHAWSYELDGRLRLAPRFDAGNFDPSTIALIPVRNAEWGGWVFVNVSGDAPPFEQHLGSLADALVNWECDRLVVAHTHRYELAANWKIAIENYNECYHCPLIHPELARVSPPESGDNHDGRGAWVGGSMDHRRLRGDDVADGTLRRRRDAQPHAEATASGPVLRGVPEPAGEPPP